MELPLAWPTCTGVYALYLAALPCVLCIKTIIHPRNNLTHTQFGLVKVDAWPWMNQVSCKTHGVAQDLITGHMHHYVEGVS